ncbi:phage protease [Phaeobacter inhibens]|uniref:phage protease n=1 Tax=Phaeobacter inhibens TaxID=221822 RepID=UPI00076BB914|nr:phage protease [Phaeobacter inhibens]KXF92128.1 hypothetical protein AT574_03830 [Phaeobacter inhibens]WHP69930.1 phage protease [Phaeobacter inhibens]
MSKEIASIALCAQNLSGPLHKADAPEWVHLLPAVKGEAHTGDNRGPYHVTDAEQIIANSFNGRERLPIDENHATDLAAPRGMPAPARGWITAMQARADGIWGKVEWTDEGRDLVASRAYREISPVITHTTEKAILGILRASLVNRPNLKGLVSLNQEEDVSVSFMEKLAKSLGLKADATEDQISAAVAKLAAKSEDTPALQSQLIEIGTALGVADGGDIVAAAKAAKSNPGDFSEAITALQSENAGLVTSLNALTTERALEKATAFVDGEMSKGRAVPKAMRGHYIAMHQEDPARVEKEIGGLPILGASGATFDPPEVEGEISLNSEQSQTARLLGISPEDYAATLEAERKSKGHI